MTVGSKRAIDRMDQTNTPDFWDSMVTQFGGLETITTKWKNTIDTAIDGGDVKLALEAFRTLAHLCEVATNQRKVVAEMSKFSNDQLSEELIKEVMRMIKTDPTGSIVKKLLESVK